MWQLDFERINPVYSPGAEQGWVGSPSASAQEHNSDAFLPGCIIGSVAMSTGEPAVSPVNCPLVPSPVGESLCSPDRKGVSLNDVALSPLGAGTPEHRDSIHTSNIQNSFSNNNNNIQHMSQNELSKLASPWSGPDCNRTHNGSSVVDLDASEEIRLKSN